MSLFTKPLLYDFVSL